jgi:hypothetical protein
VHAVQCRKKEDEMRGAAETDVFGTWGVRRGEGGDGTSDVIQ